MVYGKIFMISDSISLDVPWDVEEIDCAGKIVCPGFIDQHVHITGGGGEEGPLSKVPELMLGEIVSAGVTTVVGVLGVDGITRSTAELLAKARSLELEGITSYIYTGSYNVPTTTLMGRAAADIALIDKVIGIGEIAISDYRSSYPSTQTLKELASEARVGGMIGGKAGVLHLHVGDGKDRLRPLFNLVNECDFPLSMFVPTHLNRNRQLFNDALEYARTGGYIDLTAGEITGTGYSVADAIVLALQHGIDPEHITVSSDGNGSVPQGAGEGSQVGKVVNLFNDIRECIVGKRIDISIAIRTVTSNAARILGIYPVKGILAENSDADIVVLNKDFTLDKVFAKGQLMVDKGKLVRKGRFES